MVIHYITYHRCIFKNWICSLTERQKRPTVLKAFINVLEVSGRKPTKVQTDAGVEFTNRAFKSTLKKQNIHLYVTFSENKAAVVERFNRMWRYFMHNNTYRYVDVLQELASGYNASPHKGVGMTPIEVNNSNQLKIWKRYYSRGVNGKPVKFSIGDHVCISRDKGVFAKGFVQSLSEEYFVIESHLSRTPNVSVLRTLSGETLQGVFYAEQLQRVKAPDVFPIFRIVRKSGKRALV